MSALQKFATCPYQFVLSAIYRFAPNEQPEPLQRLDPLTRGSLFHEVQAKVLRVLREQQLLPLRQTQCLVRSRVLEATLDRRHPSTRSSLAPAIERVWRDEIAGISRDLRVWIRKLPDAMPWMPEYFEYSFGLADEGRDPTKPERIPCGSMTGSCCAARST